MTVFTGDAHRRSWMLLAGLTGVALAAVAPGVVPGDRASGGGGVSIGADGRFVAFSSTAGNLVPGDTNDVGDVFRRALRRG